MTNLLFICSRNQWRSPTAETLWRRHPDYQARSAGTSPRARRTVSIKDIDWADVIFLMEDKHRDRLRAQFPRPLAYKPLHILNIEDNYRYMDPELVAELEALVTPILERI